MLYKKALIEQCTYNKQNQCGLANLICACLSGGCRAAYTDSDSDWSSLERRKLAAEMYRGGSGVGGGVSVGTGRKPTPHKRTRKKRAAIPVATPRVPPFGDAASAMLSYRYKEDKGAFSAMSFL